MKKLKFFSLALVALTLGACSSDDVVDPGKSKPEFGADGTGYMKLTIELPTQSANNGTRANDVTDDGLPSEYAVNDATLILFAGEEPNTATFEGAYDMSLNWNDGIDNDQITTQGTKVQQINSITLGEDEDVYALVVLNKNNVLSVGSDNSLTVNGSAFNGTFAEFTAKTVASEAAFTGNGFFMTNAVVTNQPGSAALSSPTTTILVPVTTKIYPTEAEAERNPAADIMVERAVAKVQLTESMADNSITVGSNTLTYDIEGWTLANKNNSSYLVRNWDQNVSGITPSGDAWYALHSNGDGAALTTALTANPYRFAGYNLIKEDTNDPASNYYRTYWGVDPNYNTNGNFTDAPTDAAGMTFNSNLKYCLENTFDVAHQNVQNTTCAIVKVKFALPEDWGSNNFYTVDGNTTAIYKLDEAKNAVEARAMTLFRDVVVAAFESYTEESGGNFTGITPEATLATTRDANTGNLAVTAVTFTGTYNGSGTPTATTYTLSSEQLAMLNQNVTVTEYENAESYYPILIKHFGDDLTPWNRDQRESEAYPTTNQNDNWLGRYGVLRNNWYELNVTGVTGIGSATVPSVNTDPTTDDQVSNYISVKINVLSWAKRTQDVEL